MAAWIFRASSPADVLSSPPTARAIAFFSLVEQVAVLVDGFFGGTQHAMRFHAILGETALLEIGLAVLDGIEEHLLDGRVIETVRGLHAHGLLEPRRFFVSFYIQ